MRLSTRIYLVLLWLLCSTAFNSILLCDGINPDVVCHEKEKRTLLSFKQGLTDTSNKLSSWSVQQDCCRWTGVRCNNVTGRIIELHLQNPYDNFDDSEYESYKTHQLGGKITPSLLELEYLTYLDLSRNNFTTIPTFLGSMASLRYLNLSYSVFKGSIPHQLGNLSTLRILDLSNNNLEGLIPHQLGNLSTLHHLDLGNNYQLYVDDLSWIAGLHSLEYLEMSRVDLHKAVDWLQAVSMLPSLSELYLSDCQLEKMIPPLVYVNFTSLKVLDLHGNHFNCHIPDWLCNLEYLEFLSLAGNSLYGNIPTCLGNLSSLKILHLYDNELNGTIPRSMGFLSNLEDLSVSDNSLKGIVSEENFGKLSKLKILDMSSNSLIFNVSSNWVPPFQLHRFVMNSCKIGPRFPSWLQTQASLTILDISQAGISSSAPEWLWKWMSRIEYINLSDNQINGDISNVLLNSSVIGMKSNNFKGQLPRLSPNVELLNLSNNSFSGSISPFLCQEMNGKCKLQRLDLSNNLLSGGLPHCWMHFPNLTHVNLGRNNLCGKIPNSMGSLSALKSLQLHHNNFFGEMSFSLKNCTSLVLISLGENAFTGLIPSWIGEIIYLRVLGLRSNKFTGNIASEICQLSQLTVLDLGNNRISGPIPKCLNNISAMTIVGASESRFNDSFINFYSGLFLEESLLLVTKGREIEYQGTLEYVRSIDLSSNNLSGSIPDEFASLHALQFLNLSRNQIFGKIPRNIGAMTMLESLDLSRNRLLGEIPQSMSNLTFLSYLDLSYNNFFGRIPSSTQLQSFNATSYIGNAELCGAPLNNHCIRKEPQGREMAYVKKEEDVWFYIGMCLGFTVGFWVVCGTLLLKKTWRHAYYHLLDDMKDQIYFAILLKLNWLRRKFKRFNDA